MSRRFLVVGAGAWGTALAILLANNGHSVGLWSREASHREAMRTSGRNEQYLPQCKLPPALNIVDDLSSVSSFDYCLVSVPSKGFASTLKALKAHLNPKQGIIWATKGLDHGSGKFLSDIADDILGKDFPKAILTGPSFAAEVATGHPTAVILATNQPAFGEQLQPLVHTPYFRTYLSDDMIGAQLGGAVKNVLAIAVGIADGLEYGKNTQVLLITRGLAEMLRLGRTLGAQPETFNGLAGLGDLILTSSDNQSRNRRFGKLLGEGCTIDEARDRIHQVVEGADTARLIYQLAQEQQVEMPITEQIYQILFNGASLESSIQALLSRKVD